VRLVERAFGIGPSALTETMIMLNKHFGSVANSDTVSKIGLMYCQGQLR
jgi:hypothetical protein